MKKNAMLKIAAILMVAVLLTTCAISSTFAKYVDTKEISTSARVAMFGYALDTEFTGVAFEKTYASETDGFTGDVVSSTKDDLMVAPGTSGDLSYDSKISILGTSEVAVEIKSDVVFTWDDATYCPIIFTVGSGTDEVKYMTKDLDPENGYENVAALLSALNSALSFDYNLAPGATEAEKADGTKVSVEDLFDKKTVTWTWEYDHTGSDELKNTLNAKDTALGNAGTAKLGLTITQSITQIN